MNVNQNHVNTQLVAKTFLVVTYVNAYPAILVRTVVQILIIVKPHPVCTTQPAWISLLLLNASVTSVGVVTAVNTPALGLVSCHT